MIEGQTSTRSWTSMLRLSNSLPAEHRMNLASRKSYFTGLSPSVAMELSEM